MAATYAVGAMDVDGIDAEAPSPAANGSASSKRQKLSVEAGDRTTVVYVEDDDRSSSESDCGSGIEGTDGAGERQAPAAGLEFLRAESRSRESGVGRGRGGARRAFVMHVSILAVACNASPSACSVGHSTSLLLQ